MKKIIVSISLLSLLLNFGCNTEHESGKEEEAKFLVTNPLKKDTTITKEYVCQFILYNTLN